MIECEHQRPAGLLLVVICFAVAELLGCAEIDLTPDDTETVIKDDISIDSDSDSTVSSSRDSDTTERDSYSSDSESGASGVGAACTFETAVKKCGDVDLCVDGYCCDNRCDRACESCGLPGKEGVCTVFDANADPEGECGTCRVCNGDDDAPACVGVGYGEDIKGDCDMCRFCNGENEAADCIPSPMGMDPFDDCDADKPVSCGQTGACDGYGGCAFYGDNTPCQATTCSDFEAASRQYMYRCDGTGECVETPFFCGGYLCDAVVDECRRTCRKKADCLDGFSCIKGSCVVDSPKDDGEQCLAGDECASEFCVDGVCCDTACDGNCVACDLSDSKGVCSPVPPNTDPKDDCPTCFVCGESGKCVLVPKGEDAADDCREQVDDEGCGLSGYCDGVGGCAFRTAEYACGDASCEAEDGVSFVTALVCDGLGNCEKSVSSCGAYVCGDDDKCLESCKNGDECVSDASCDDKRCVSDAPNGAGCTSGVECESGHCVDGVCCESRCDGDCERCDLQGREGTCSTSPNNTDFDDDCPVCEVCTKGKCEPAEAGSDPTNDCTEGRPGECGYTGFCDGDGGCGLRGDDYQCGTICVDEHVAPFFCNGEDIGRAGCVVEGEQTACDDSLACDPWTASCPTECLSHADCIAGTFCNDEGDCESQKENAGACESGGMCVSGFCVDGVCCDSACDADCSACNLPDTEGTCRSVPVNTDPNDECPACWACNDSGDCAPLTEKSAPEGDCKDEDVCGHTGRCMEGACEYVPDGTVCGDLICAGAENLPNVTRYECDGEGECVELSDQTCGGYRCASESECLTECEDASDCAVSFSCNDDICTSDNPDGTPCMLDSECKSNICVDGYCCDAACDGQCEACDIDGSLGTCTLEPSGSFGTRISSGLPDCGVCEVCDGSGECRPVDTVANTDDPSDPRNLCGDPGEPEACGLTGVCENGAGECAYYPTNQLCNVTCPYPGTDVFDWYCNGAGDCVVDSDGEKCPERLTCRETEDGCRTECLNQNHCDSVSYCSGGECVQKKSGGEPCEAKFECFSGYCPDPDGVCCDAACNGVCESCNQEDNFGICLPVPLGENPDDECNDGRFCTLNDYCDGAGACTSDGNPCDEDNENLCDDCNEATDNCIQAPGTACGSPVDNDCTMPDTCNSSGICLSNHFPDEDPCEEDSDPCSYDYCEDGVCTHPDSGNSDDDTICDAQDNCPEVTNENQSDVDDDDVGDACDECPTDPNKTEGPCLKAEIYVERYDNMIIVHFEIVNHGTLPVDPRELSLRYWYTVDSMFDFQQFRCFWVDAHAAFPAQCDNMVMGPESAVFHPVSVMNANYYVKVAFRGDLADIPPSAGGIPGRSGKMQLAWNTSPFSNFNPFNDYSYTNTNALAETSYVTIYDGEELIWGVEPQ